MTLTLDHISLCVTKDAPEADILQKNGLFLAPDRETHAGQGTASVFFYFRDFYLELIWVDNPAELERADFAFSQRFNATDNASPFGIGLSRPDSATGQLPFETTPYHAEWMKPHTAINVAVTENFQEPRVFVVPGYMSWRQGTKDHPSILRFATHPAGMKALTRVHVSIPNWSNRSSVLEALEEDELSTCTRGSSHLLELLFDDGKSDRAIDCRPRLPLVIRH